MTEYDYSPEAYQRYIDSQNRIAKWVDNTNAHSHEFRHPFGQRSDVGSPAPNPNPNYHHGSGSGGGGGGGGGSGMTRDIGSTTMARRRNSISYQPRGSTSRGPTSAISSSTNNRSSYPYPVSRTPITPAPAPVPVPTPSRTQTQTQTRTRSLSQSYTSSPIREPSTYPQRRVVADPHVSSHHSTHSRTGSRSYAPPHNTHNVVVHPRTGNPPTRSGTYPVYHSSSSSKPSHHHYPSHSHSHSHSHSQSHSHSRPPPPPSSSSHLKPTTTTTTRNRDRSHSLSHSQPHSHPHSHGRTTPGYNSRTQQYILPPSGSGVTSPATTTGGGRGGYKAIPVIPVTKPTNVAGYMVIPGAPGDVRIVY